MGRRGLSRESKKDGEKGGREKGGESRRESEGD